MLTLPDLRGRQVLLRRPVDTDVDALVRLPIDPETVRLYGGVHRGATVRSRDRAQRTIAWMRAEPVLWVIDAGGYIGHVRLHARNTSDRRASLAIGIDSADHLGHGLGTEAMCLMLGYAFEAMSLHRVSLRVLAFNTRAIRAYAKVGFVREGLERQSAWIDNEWHDDVIMGLLAHEFAPSSARFTASDI